MTLEQIVVAAFSGSASAALIIVVLRLAGPFISKLVGGVLKTRAELDADRDRIIKALREEIADWRRRLEEAERRAARAEERAEEAERRAEDADRRVEELDEFVTKLVRRLGTTRAQVDREGA